MRLISVILIISIVSRCQTAKEKVQLNVDHINIWVENPQLAKKQLEQIGFTAVPDSLCQIHKGQGTTGRYFYFLNTYLELIFINDEVEFEENIIKNKALDFEERANHATNGFSPFSVALNMEHYDKMKIPFETIPYTQEWMGQFNKIYAAENSKIHKGEPSIFVVYPKIEYDVFKNKEDLSKIPEQYSIWRTFYQHQNEAEKISKVKIYSTELNNESETVKALENIENIEVVKGEAYLMELYFDDQVKGEIYDMRPVLPLKIYL